MPVRPSRVQSCLPRCAAPLCCRDGRALQALAQDSDSELEPSDSESEGGHSNGYPADGRWFIDDWTRHNWTAGGADPDEVRHWLAMSQGHLEMNDVYRSAR